MKLYTWDALFNAIVLSIFVTCIMQWGARAKQMYNHFNTGWAGISINGTLFIFVSLWMCQQFTLHCNRKNKNGIYALHILRDWVLRGITKFGLYQFIDPNYCKSMQNFNRISMSWFFVCFFFVLFGVSLFAETITGLGTICQNAMANEFEQPTMVCRFDCHLVLNSQSLRHTCTFAAHSLLELTWRARCKHVHLSFTSGRQKP